MFHACVQIYKKCMFNRAFQVFTTFLKIVHFGFCEIYKQCDVYFGYICSYGFSWICQLTVRVLLTACDYLILCVIST